MKLLYLSQGNIPSRWAHSIQAMKMAEGFAQTVAEFEFIVQAPPAYLSPNRFPYEQHYGIIHPFHVVVLPGAEFEEDGYYRQVWYPDFYSQAVSYLRASSADLFFTRSPEAAKQMVRYEMPTVLEIHMGPGIAELSFVKEIATDPNLLGVVTIHDKLAAFYQSLGVPHEKLLVFPDCVNLGAYDMQRSIPSSLPEATGRKRAVYSGHLYPNRGVEEMLYAAEKLPAVEFYFVGGWDSDVDKWRDASSHLKNVSFVGFRRNDEIPSYLLSADVLLMPYSANQENMEWASPLKLFEYMAAKKPIVCTKVPCIEGILQHERNAIIVEPDCGASLVAGIERVLEDQQMADELATNAREAVQPFQWKNRAQEIVSYYG